LIRLFIVVTSLESSPAEKRGGGKTCFLAQNSPHGRLANHWW
jgi:hypothetical protein